MNKHKLLSVLHDLLNDLHADRLPATGICGYVRHNYSSAAEEALLPMMFTWPKWSGCESYVVPHPLYQDHAYNVEFRIRKASEAYDFDLWVGAYGALRVELLYFLIAELGKELS